MNGLTQLLVFVAVTATAAYVLFRTPLGARLQRRIRVGAQASVGRSGAA